MLRRFREQFKPDFPLDHHEGRLAEKLAGNSNAVASSTPDVAWQSLY